LFENIRFLSSFNLLLIITDFKTIKDYFSAFNNWLEKSFASMGNLSRLPFHLTASNNLKSRIANDGLRISI